MVAVPKAVTPPVAVNSQYDLPPALLGPYGRVCPRRAGTDLIGGQKVPGRHRADSREGESADVGTRGDLERQERGERCVRPLHEGRAAWATAPMPAGPGSRGPSSPGPTMRDWPACSAKSPSPRRRIGLSSRRRVRSWRRARSVLPAPPDPGSRSTWCSCPHWGTRHRWEPRRTGCSRCRDRSSLRSHTAAP